MEGSVLVSNRRGSKPLRPRPHSGGRKASSSSSLPATRKSGKGAGTPPKANPNEIPTRPVGMPIPLVGPNMRLLDSGATASVYEYVAPDGKKYVIKKFHDNLPPEEFLYFRNHEFRAASHFLGKDVRHIAAVVGIDPTENTLMFVKVPGVNLQKLLIKHGPLPPNLAARIIDQAAKALTEIKNKGYIHRDIKPANIMVYERNGQVFARVIDIGIALPTSEATQNTSQAGTPGYWSPEQAKGEPLTPKADCWSLGATLYRMLTGKRIDPLIAPGNLKSYIMEVPPEFQSLLTKMLAFDPEARISAEDISSECGKILKKIGLPQLTGNNQSTTTSPSLKTAPGTVALPTAGTLKVPAWNGTEVMPEGGVLITPDGTEVMPEEGKVVTPDGTEVMPRPKPADIPEISGLIRRITTSGISIEQMRPRKWLNGETPWETTIAEGLKKHNYSDAEIKQVIGELRWKILLGRYQSRYTTAGGFESNIVKTLSKQIIAISGGNPQEHVRNMTAEAFYKLQRAIDCLGQEWAQTNLKQSQGNIEQLRPKVKEYLQPLIDLSFSVKQMRQLGAEREAVVTRRARIEAGIELKAKALLGDPAKGIAPGNPPNDPLEVERWAKTLEVMSKRASRKGAKEEAKELAELAEKLRTWQKKAPEDKPPTTEEANLISKINKLAKKAGLKSVINKKSLAKLLEVLEDPIQMKKLTKKLEKGLNPQKLAKLLRKLVKEGKINPVKAADLLEAAIKLEEKRLRGEFRREVGKQIFKQHAAGVLVGLVTLIGAEAVADYLGIKNKYLRLTFVLGLAHVGNKATISIYKSGLKASCQELLTSVGVVTKALATLATRANTPLLKRMRTIGTILNKKVGRPAMKFSFGLVSSLAMFSVVGRSYDYFLKELGFGPESAPRSGMVNTIASFVIPSAAGGVFQYTQFLLSQRVDAIAAQAGRATALRSVSARLLGGLRFAGGALPYVFVAMEGVNLMSSAFITDYEADANKRMYELLIAKGIYDPSVGGHALAATVTSFQINRVLTDHIKPWSNNHPIIKTILDQDRTASDSIQNNLALLCSTLIMRDVQNGTEEAEQNLSEYFAPVEWGYVTWEKSASSSSRPTDGSGGSSAASQHEPGMQPIPVRVSEKDFYEFATEFVNDHNKKHKDKQIGIGHPTVVAAAVKKFQLKNSGQYTRLLPKFQKAMLQTQIANLYAMDPDRYGILPGQVVSNGKNDDIRVMFTAEGKLKPGQVQQLMQWALANGPHKEMLKSIRSSSRQIILRGTKEQKLRHKLEIARMRCEYLKATSAIKKAVIGQILRAMGDNLDWTNDQEKANETKELVAEFDSFAQNTPLSDEQKIRLLLANAQLDEIIKLA